MFAELMFFAAALQQPAQEEVREDPDIHVRGNRILCRRLTPDSAQTRIGQQRVCLTSRQWDEQRDQAVELLLDLPRRNPPSGGAAPNPNPPQ
ncbi:MAG TPA: hypothetical protein VF702_01205 [Allosphingosinicella sp.]|jgi:hypothetical protein